MFAWPTSRPSGRSSNAGEIRIFQTPPTLDAAIEMVTKARDAAQDTPFSAFCLFELSKLPEGLPVVLSALKQAGLEWITQAPVDRLKAPEQALEALTDAGLQLARLTIDETPARPGRTCAATSRSIRRRLGSIRAFAPLARKIDPDPTDYRLRRRETDCVVAAVGRKRRQHPGRLGAVRAQARAGRADVRRRRHRFGVGRGRRFERPPAVASRGNPPQHSRRRVRACRARAGNLRVIRLGRRQLSEYAAAGVWARTSGRSIQLAVRCARAMRGVAACGRGRPRADPLNRIRRTRLPDRAGRVASPRMARSPRSRSSAKFRPRTFAPSRSTRARARRRRCCTCCARGGSRSIPGS